MKRKYDRNIKIDWIGEDGQEKIERAKVLVVGAGGLGSPAIMYLASAGVGTIGICEYDTVDETNLNRQVIHAFSSVGKSKAESAKKAVLQINPDISVELYPEKLVLVNAEKTTSGFDFVIDATDSFESKFLINDICVRTGKPFSHAGALRSGGQAITYIPGSACLRCIIKEPPLIYPAASEEGILGAVAGTLGTLQAAEAIKFITGRGELLVDRLLSYDAFKMKFRELSVKKREGCICG